MIVDRFSRKCGMSQCGKGLVFKDNSPDGVSGQSKALAEEVLPYLVTNTYIVVKGDLPNWEDKKLPEWNTRIVIEAFVEQVVSEQKATVLHC